LLRHGFRRFVLVNGHGGNMTACEEMCLRLREATTVDVLTAVTYFTLAPLPATALEHAGEIETSFGLALAPQVVRLDQLVPAEMADSGHVSPDVTRGRPFHEITRTGNLGDPRRATRDRGQHLVDTVLDRLCEIITSLDRTGDTVHALNRRGRKEGTGGAHTVS
jgi:creatinine amidohydrolase